MKTNRKDKVVVGCFADDFTGASDIGSFFVKGKLNTILINGIPNENFKIDSNVQAIVIALKSRSQEKNAAIEDSIKAYEYFKQNGCNKVYFKYCSTFDSTKEGNIGPVIDAILEKYNIPYTIICPSLPVNGRTVKDGCLLVNGVPLHESHMRNHPVNPMWDCKIKILMEDQAKYKCHEISINEIKDLKLFQSKLSRVEKEEKHFYFVPEYYKDEHGQLIASTFTNLPFITGGSGLAKFVSKEIQKEKPIHITEVSKHQVGTKGPAIILAGSCSKATREQIKNFIDSGGEAIELDPLKIKEGKVSSEEIINKLSLNTEKTLLIHTTGNGVYQNQNENSNITQQEISFLLESKMADIALKAVEVGVKRIITAGGETSGAITKALGFNSYLLSDSVFPGVPVMIPTDNKEIRIVLKSGNFGQPDFFNRVLEFTKL